MPVLASEANREIADSNVCRDTLGVPRLLVEPVHPIEGSCSGWSEISPSCAMRANSSIPTASIS